MVILGTGIDIIEIMRIKSAMDRSPSFAGKVYTDGENRYFESRGDNPCHAAGTFAAKEAVLKALGTGLRNMGWKDIEIARDSLGKPCVVLHGNAKTVADSLGIERMHISISHSREYAIAEAIAEGYNDRHEGKLMIEDTILEGFNGNQECDVSMITGESIKPLFPERKKDSNKGTYGRAYIIAGSRFMMGAAAMSALSALRCGTGIVELAVPSCIQPQVAQLVMEAIVDALYDEDGVISYDALDEVQKSICKSSGFAIGPGISRSEGLSRLLNKVIKDAVVPGVIDADGLNLLAEDTDILCSTKSTHILTPHPGEMARLTKRDVKYVQANRIECARDFSLKYKVVTVLKGAGTIIASPGGEVYMNTTGNPGMAKGGSGDVLTGMIVSFLAQGMEPVCAARAGVFLHGLAGDMASKDKGEYGMKAGDIIDYIPYAIKFL